MKIILAKSSGFCFGVKHAVDTVEELLRTRSDARIFTVGKLIHNPSIISDLERRGVEILPDADGLCEDAVIRLADCASEADRVIVVVRAHGVTRRISELLTECAARNPYFEFVDCTCPRVKNIHDIVDNNSSERTVTLVVGDEKHPEVRGIASYAKGEAVVLLPSSEGIDDDAHVSPSALAKLHNTDLIAVAQTTLDLAEWKNSQKNIQKYCTNAIIFDTICNVTGIRQTEAYDLSKNVDLMLVIGGRESSNTNKLYNIAAQGMARKHIAGQPENSRYTFLVESEKELPLDLLTPNITVGITAGASTPSGIIEEVLKTMTANENTQINDISEEDFAGMLESSLKTLNTGETVKGTITSITPNEIHVDLGTKVTGIIPYSEITDNTSVKLDETYHVGDEIEAIVVKVSDLDGVATLSRRRIENIISWRKIVDAFNEGTILEGKYLDPVKGGVIMQLDGVRVFVPASHTGVPKDVDLATLTGKTARVKIIEINEQRRRAVASARTVIREERKVKETEFWANIEVGKQYDGVVKSLTSYGAFVDLGGVDGMVHSSELSWKRIHHPSEVVSVGDNIHVYVKAFDAETHRISLGYKTEETNPWTVFTAKYAVGDVAQVKVVSMMPFGAFAEVVPGADGLIHISEIADHKISKPADVLEIGQIVDAKIIDIDYENHKISLSMRALLNGDDEAEGDSEE